MPGANRFTCPFCLMPSFQLKVDKHEHEYMSCTNENCGIKVFGVRPHAVVAMSCLSKVISQPAYAQLLIDTTHKDFKDYRARMSFAEVLSLRQTDEYDQDEAQRHKEHGQRLKEMIGDGKR